MEIQIVTGFQDAGKTTLLNKILPVLSGKTAVIQNEFGQIKLDTEVVQKDIFVTELTSGCICCSLALGFQNGIKEIVDKYKPDRIVIESSGIAKVSDIIKVCQELQEKGEVFIAGIKIVVLVDLSFYEDAAEGFGEFYLDQIRHAGLILLSNLEEIESEEKDELIGKIQKKNSNAFIYKEDWRLLEQNKILELFENIPSCGELSVKMTCKVRAGNKGKSRTIIPMDLEKLEHDLEKLEQRKNI